MLTNLEMQTALEKAFKQTGPEARRWSMPS